MENVEHLQQTPAPEQHMHIPQYQHAEAAVHHIKCPLFPHLKHKTRRADTGGYAYAVREPVSAVNVLHSPFLFVLSCADFRCILCSAHAPCVRRLSRFQASLPEGKNDV